MQQYLSNHNILSMLVERRRNRTVTRHSRQHRIDRNSQKFNKMIKQMKKEKEVVDNKYFRRNKRIQELFSKRLVKIKEYCARYKKGQRRGILGIKPHAATKTFSLGILVSHAMYVFPLLEPRSKLITCRTAKHGSTSWTNNLVQIYKGWVRQIWPGLR